MRRWIFFSFFAVVAIAFVATSLSYFDDPNPRLAYLGRFNIEQKNAGLNEPSGLALSRGRNALWTVSDDTNRIFQLNLVGELQEDQSFEIPNRGLEGIALDPTGEFLFMVNEDENEIIKLDTKTQQITDQRPLSEMAGYNSVADYFENSPPNKGLEGITWNSDTGSIFVMKEGVPGLLLEVSPNLTTIQNHRLLNDKNGFIDDNAVGYKLDFSGICYDPKREQFWIVSDKGRRLFLYDWEGNIVVRSVALGYRTKKGKYGEIVKVEGVALDSGSDRLYMVSDKEARLYVFDIRE